jgi:magnesium chelatase subunit I
MLRCVMASSFRSPSPGSPSPSPRSRSGSREASRPATLGQLRTEVAGGRLPRRSVKDEIRANLIDRLQSGETLFPGIIGFDDTVVPQIVNAILSRHNFILLGLRGQAKSRILRTLVDLLDDAIAVVPGCEIHDDPLDPICAACRARVRDAGDEMPIAWLDRDARYVEKLATPDVTIADLIGDLDPIKAARAGLQLSDELTMHYGLLPRANRGVFAVNELPDLAGKVQVGLFNILQEGDVQIKGYPVRLPLDVLLVFSANPEDYTARGKIITPLKDRIGSEIRTHYPVTRQHAMAITAQEAWVDRGGCAVEVPAFVREVVEEVAFQARQDQKIDKRSGVSQRLPISLLENVISSAERRAIQSREPMVVPRITDIYAALPAITGKFELEYEGELRGADSVARDVIRAAVGNVFGGYFAGVDLKQVTEWFDLGGSLQIDDTLASAELLERAAQVQGLRELATHAGIGDAAQAPAVASAVDFILEGLYAQKKISRSDEFQYQGAEPPRRAPRGVTAETIIERDVQIPGSKKKYYN